MVKNGLVLTMIVLLGFSCKKGTPITGGTALNIVHVDIGAPSFYVYFTYADSAFYQQNSSIGYGSNMEFGLPAGSTPVTLVSMDDTTKILYQSTFKLRTGGIYSFYFAGQYPNTDTLFMEDNIPFIADSSSSVRFVDLSQSTGPISINLQGNSSSQTEFTPLTYKGVSGFKNYPINGGISSYTFEVWDQKAGTLLTTFTWNITPFKANTLVINGSADPNSSTPIGVLQVNNF